MDQFFWLEVAMLGAYALGYVSGLETGYKAGNGGCKDENAI